VRGKPGPSAVWQNPGRRPRLLPKETPRRLTWSEERAGAPSPSGPNSVPRQPLPVVHRSHRQAGCTRCAPSERRQLVSDPPMSTRPERTSGNGLWTRTLESVAPGAP